MKPEVEIKPLPHQERKKLRQRNQGRVLYQEIKENRIHTYLYSNGEYRSPSHIIVADVPGQKWDTYDVDGKKWGKATIDYLCSWYTPFYCHQIDADRFGISVEVMQKDVLEQKRRIKKEKIQQRISHVMDLVRPLTKTQIEFMKKNQKNYAIYTPGQQGAECTCCGSRIEGTYINNKKYRCPECKKSLIARTRKTLPAMEARTYFFVQKIRDGIVMRVVTYQRIYKAGVCVGHYEYTQAEGTCLVENVRVVVMNGDRQRWYERRTWESDEWSENRAKTWVKNRNSPYRYEKSWYDTEQQRYCYKNSPIWYKKGIHVIEQASAMRYIDAKYFRRIEEKLYSKGGFHEKVFGWLGWYETLNRYPQIESLIKLDFLALVCDLYQKMDDGTIGVHAKERELHKFLGIKKEGWRYLVSLTTKQRQDISLDFLKRFREAEKYCTNIDIILKIASSFNQAEMYELFDVAHLSPWKVARYIPRINTTMFGYVDYIRMAGNLNMNLKDEFVAFPSDTRAAHDQLIAIRDEEKNRKKVAQEKKYDSSIEKIYKKIKNQYSLVTNEYIIRPVSSAREIVIEGQTLHHCVGCGRYRDKILKNESYILLLRKKEEPDTPFWTVEILPNGKIIQAYAAYDKKPEYNEKIRPVLEQLTERVKRYGKKHHAEK